MDLKDEKSSQEFMVNGQQIKHYIGDVLHNLREDVSLTDLVWADDGRSGWMT